MLKVTSITGFLVGLLLTSPVFAGATVGSSTWYQADGFVVPSKNAACVLAPSLELARDIDRLRTKLKSRNFSQGQVRDIQTQLNQGFHQCLNFAVKQPAILEIQDVQIAPSHYRRDIKATITSGPLAGKTGWTVDSTMDIPSGQMRVIAVTSTPRVTSPHACHPQTTAPDFVLIVAGMGESGVLWIPDTPAKLHDVPVFPTVEAYLAWQHLTNTRGALNTATQVKSGTCAVVLQQIREAADAAFLQIRVLTGPHAGTIGYVPTGWIFESNR